VLATDKPYRNRYMSRARVEDGLIRRYAEFSDPLTFMEAFTLMTDTTLTAEDRIEIHELLARRGYASDTADVAGWVATFTSDGVLEQPPVELDLPGGASKMPSTVEGTDALTAFLEDSLPNIKGLRHLITNTTTDPTTGGGAIARSAFHVLDVIRSVTVVTGRYTDTLKRTDEGWKTVHLNVDVDG
jgi:ketosteroid isomerase-like protein